jgi:hypothetical protein
LTHNVHGPHDDKFYKYLSDLQDEYDALQRSGYAGEGFFSEGKRLGMNVSHNDPPHIARRKALEAAEKRKHASRVLGGGGRLGGQNRNAGVNPRELAARVSVFAQVHFPLMYIKNLYGRRQNGDYETRNLVRQVQQLNEKLRRQRRRAKSLI